MAPWRLRAALIAVVAFATTFGALPPARATSDDSARQRLVRVVRSDLEAHPGIPGEAVSIRADGLHLDIARGFADVATKTPLRADTPFRIASVTKTFVAAAVMRLSERGSINLDDPIARYLSTETLTMLTSDGYSPGQITARELLDHSSGLFDYATSGAYDRENVDNPSRVWTRADQLELAVVHGQPVAAPGAEFHYADTNYLLLGEVLERRTGLSLAQAVRSTIGFDRIGLDHTYWEVLEPAPAGQSIRAHQYYDTTFDNVVLDPSSDLFGGGGLVSTVGDLTRFYAALFGGEVFSNDATLDAMLTVARPGRQAGAGLGIFATRVAGERCWGHPGYWGTVTAYCPKSAVAFAIATNQADEAELDTTLVERTAVELARESSRR